MEMMMLTHYKDHMLAFLRRYRPLAFMLDLQENTSRDYIGLVAAGIAFYFLLAAFPAIGAMISLYGLLADPHSVTEQLGYFSRFLPHEAYTILIEQADKVASSHEGILSLGVFIGLAVAIYSASKGVRALIKGFNIAFKLREKRNVLALGATGYILTFVMLFYFLISLSLVAGVPIAVNYIVTSETLSQLFTALRWPILFVIGMIGLEILYYYGPCHEVPRWRWFSWGSFTATTLWLLSSVVFSYFVSHTESYNETYGSLGAVIVLMLWFWISAMMIMFGAEVNGLLSKYKRH